MKYKIFIVSITVLLCLSVAWAATTGCSITTKPTSLVDLQNSVSQLNSELTNCPQKLITPLNWLFRNEVIHVDLSGPDLYATTAKGSLSGLANSGTPTGWRIEVDDCSLDAALKDGAVSSVMAHAMVQGKVKIYASGFKRGLILRIAKPILNGALKKMQKQVPLQCANQQTTQPANVIPQTYPKPANCDETYMQGHRGYAENSALWDGYMADSDGVCQSSRPVSCKYNIQLSVSGTPYYLCWYDN